MTNVGYTIIMHELFNERELLGVALGEKPASFPDITGEDKQYVTWEYRMDPGHGPSYFWGHYFGHRDAAFKDYHQRLADEYSIRVEWREREEDED